MPLMNNFTMEKTECPICLEEIKNAQSTENIKTICCDHYFHHNCFHKWCASSNTCPICRTPTRSQIQNQIPTWVNNRYSSNNEIRSINIPFGVMNIENIHDTRRQTLMHISALQNTSTFHSFIVVSITILFIVGFVLLLVLLS